MNRQISDIANRAQAARQRIAPLIYQTPLLPARSIGAATGCKLLFKAENFQFTGSFKLRGASSKMTAMASGQRLITASSGNHGIAAARAAAATDQQLSVVLPETVDQTKLNKIKSFGVETILHGTESGAAERHARQLAADGRHTYVSPYNDLEIVAGQASIGLELMEQVPHIDNLFVAMGGGGLIGGIGAVLKQAGASTRIIGVAAENSAALAASIAAGRVVETEHRATLADGVAGGVDTDSLTLPLAITVVDHVVHCDETAIAAALRRLARDETLLVEGAAALALAGFLQLADQLRGQTNVIVLCGGNFDPTTIYPLIS